jgi:hypothetical protein
MRALRKELKQYNQVFLPGYKQFLNHTLVQVRALIKNSDPESYRLEIEEMRRANFKFQNLVNFVRDNTGSVT